MFVASLLTAGASLGQCPTGFSFDTSVTIAVDAANNSGACLPIPAVINGPSIATETGNVILATDPSGRVGYRIGETTVFMDELERKNGVVNTLDLGYRIGAQTLTAQLSTAQSTIADYEGGDSAVLNLVTKLEVLGLDHRTYGTTYGDGNDVHMPVLGYDALLELSRAYASMRWFRCKWSEVDTPDTVAWTTSGFTESGDGEDVALKCPTPDDIGAERDLLLTFDVQGMYDVAFSGQLGVDNKVTFENKITGFDAVEFVAFGQGFEPGQNCRFVLDGQAFDSTGTFIDSSQIQCIYPDGLATAYGNREYSDETMVTATIPGITGQAQFSYHGAHFVKGRHCSDGVSNVDEGTGHGNFGGNGARPADCGGSCGTSTCPSCGLAEHPAFACRSCNDPLRTGPAGMYHIKGLDGDNNKAVYCGDGDNDGYALLAIVKTANYQRHIDPNAVNGEPINPTVSNTRKYSDAIINQYRALSEAAGDQGSQDWGAFKMKAVRFNGCGRQGRIQYCNSKCVFNAVNSINGNNICNECSRQPTGPNEIRWDPNSGTRGMGHHHIHDYNGAFFAWSRHPESCGGRSDPNRRGCNYGWRSDRCGQSDGEFWVK